MEQRYRIVTRGEIAASKDPQEVREEVRHLCRYGPEALELVFSGKPFVFKSGLERKEARRYLTALTGCGLVCRALPISPAVSEPVPHATSEPAAAPPEDGAVQAFVRTAFGAIRRLVGSRRQVAVGWLNRGTQQLATSAVAIAAIAVFYTGLLYGLQALWALYIETHVGQVYVANHRATARAIEAAFSIPMVPMVGSVTLLCVKWCLTVGALCRLLFVTRLLYDSRSILLRALLWGTPLAFWIAPEIAQVTGLDSRSAFLLSLLPAVALLHPCISLVSGLLPELDDVYRASRRLWRLSREESRA